MDNFVEVALWLIGITHDHSVTRCLTPKTLNGKGVQCHLAWGPAGVLGSICGLHLWLALVWPAVRCQLWAEPASSICPAGLSLLSSLGLHCRCGRAS